jgi:hypothetical protein
METGFCYECGKIVTAINEAPIPRQSSKGPFPTPLLYQGSHRSSAASFRLAARDGCGICSIIIDHLSPLNSPLKSRTVEAWFVSDFPQFRIQFLLQRTGNGSERIEVVCVNLANRSTKGLAPNIWSRFLQDTCYHGESYNNTGKEEPLELAKFWLQTCLKTHELCGKDRDPHFVPLRLLDFSEQPCD